MTQVARVVALGASNLTRGFPTLVATAREVWGPDVELVLALGLGRSYGVPSRIGVRTLPGLLESGLWRALDTQPRVPTRALVTDVGNDILYGLGAPQILRWVEQAVERLQSIADNVIVTGLPLASIERISNARFLFFRSLLAPRCRLSCADILDTSRRVDDALATLSARRGFRHVTLPAAWYGFDPVHIRPALWTKAWQKILCGEGGPPARRASWAESIRLQCLPPERQRLFGIERVVPQNGIVLPAGGRVRLY
jgi:hypothetical protein